jgi:hypothetical protein
MSSALQEKEINDIQKSGGFAYVINETNLHTLENILRSLLDEDDDDGRC